MSARSARASRLTTETAGSNDDTRVRPRGGDGLTRREQEILALLAAGLPTKTIAAQLGIKAPTVKTHLGSVYRKIGAQNRVQAARHYLDQSTALEVVEPGAGAR